MRYHCSTFGQLHHNTFWVCTTCQFSPLIWVLTLKGALHLSFCIQIKKSNILVLLASSTHFGSQNSIHSWEEKRNANTWYTQCMIVLKNRQIPQKSWSISSCAPPTIRYLKVVCEKSYFQLEMSKLQETKASNQSGSWCIWCALRKYGMALSLLFQKICKHLDHTGKKLPCASSPHTAPYLCLWTSIWNR